MALALAGGDWTTHAPLPVARTEVAAATVGREIAVVGGFLENGGSSRRVDFYAPGSDTWRSGPDLPAAVNHAAATVARGRLYVAGGYGAERSMFVLAGDALADDPRCPRRVPPRALPLCAEPSTSSAASAPAGTRARCSRTTRHAALAHASRPEAATAPCVAAARGRIYAIAGRTTGLDTNFTLVESWAPGEKRWRREAPVPEARGGTGAAASAGRSSRVGGEAPGGTVRSVYAYDVVQRRWRRLPDLRTPRHGLGVAAFGGAVYVIGGGPQPGLYVSDANESLNVAG